MPDPGRSDMQFMQALAARRKGDAKAACEVLEAILADDPNHSDSIEVLAMLLSEAGDPGQIERAIELTGRLVELQPDSIMAHANMSRFHMLLGDKETAEEWQSKARVLGWKDELRRKGGQVPEGGGLAGPDPDLVEKQEAAVAARPDDILARVALAGSYSKLGMPAKAIGHLKHALSLDGDNATVFLALGKALEQANVPGEAAETYARGIPVAEERGAYMPRNQMQSRLLALKKLGHGTGDA